MCGAVAVAFVWPLTLWWHFQCSGPGLVGYYEQRKTVCPKIMAMWEQDRRCGHHPCNCIRVVRIMVHWCTGGSGRCDSVEYLWSLSSIQHCVTQEAVIFRTPHYNPVFDVTTCHSDPDQGSRGSPPFGDCVVFCNMFIFSSGNRQSSNGNFVTFISCIANF